MREAGEKPVQYTMLQQKRWHRLPGKFSIGMYKSHFQFEKDLGYFRLLKNEKKIPLLIKILRKK